MHTSDYLASFQYSFIFKNVDYIQSLFGEPNPYALNQGHINTLPWGESYRQGREKGDPHRLASWSFLIRFSSGPMNCSQNISGEPADSWGLPSSWSSQKLIKSLPILVVNSTWLKKGTSIKRLPYFYKCKY